MFVKNKCLTITISLLLLIILSKYGYCNKGKIPENPEMLELKITHLYNSGITKEVFLINYKQSIVTTKIYFERINGSKKVLEKKHVFKEPVSEIETGRLVTVLNYIDFMNLKSTIGTQNKQKGLNEKVIFKVKYKIGEKLISKEVTAFNMEDSLIEGKNKDIFKLKYLIVSYDSLEYLTFKRGITVKRLEKKRN